MVISSLDLKDNHLNYNFSYVKFIDDNKFINEISSFCTDQFEQNINININDVACIYYSSGTTGSSKYVLYSHKNMVSLTESLVQTFHFTSNTKHLGVLPLGHTAIINYQFLPTLYIGGTLYLAENFNQIRNNVWKIISDYEIDYLQLVPTLIFAMLATKYDEADYSLNKTLSYIGCGSAPLSTESQIKFYEKFNINVANLYGLSESGPSHFDDPRLTDWQPGSIGTPLGVNDCKILDKNFVELKVGEVGQIALKGDNIFIGYYKNVEMYKKSFFENYFLTGDVGYKDETGKFYFSDREKDIIIKAGVNIVPGEIEEIIFKLPDVQSAAVVGIPDEYFGETIIAFIQKSNESLKEDEIMNILVENLQPLKMPSKIIFVDSMPVGPSGKILKRKLREDLINE